MSLIINPYRFVTPDKSLLGVIQGLSLQTGLSLCLDAGDSTSYSSGQTWVDRSGNGFNYLRGTDSSAQGSDPTFNGSAGGLSESEYWSFDGGDFFTQITGAQTWADQLKDGGKLTLLAIVYVPLSAIGNFMFLLDPGSSGDRVVWGIQADGKMVFYDSAQTQFTFASSGNVNFDGWNILGLSFDENGTSHHLCFGNDTSGTPSVTSGNTPTGAYQIGAGAGPAFQLRSGCRMAGFAAWGGVALSFDNLFNLRTNLKNLRFTSAQ